MIIKIEVALQPQYISDYSVTNISLPPKICSRNDSILVSYYFFSFGFISRCSKLLGQTDQACYWKHFVSHWNHPCPGVHILRDAPMPRCNGEARMSIFCISQFSWLQWLAWRWSHERIRVNRRQEHAKAPRERNNILFKCLHLTLKGGQWQFIATIMLPHATRDGSQRAMEGILLWEDHLGLRWKLETLLVRVL